LEPWSPEPWPREDKDCGRDARACSESGASPSIIHHPSPIIHHPSHHRPDHTGSHTRPRRTPDSAIGPSEVMTAAGAALSNAPQSPARGQGRGGRPLAAAWGILPQPPTATCMPGLLPRTRHPVMAHPCPPKIPQNPPKGVMTPARLLFPSPARSLVLGSSLGCAAGPPSSRKVM
jgi:hypothetical protein